MANGAVLSRFAVCLLFAVPDTKAVLPEPPKQYEPWTQPSGVGVPDYVIKVAATLFDVGLSDPRGGDYREVALTFHDDGKGALLTHAWVFSGKDAVCWNGLVYHVQRIGKPADLEQDVRTIAGAEPWSGRLFMRKAQPPARAAFWYDLELGQTMAPTSIALLLRLGRPDLAAQLWQAPESTDTSGRVRQRESDEGLWLATAARAWFGAAFLRLADAFERGDDQEVVDVGESLLRWQSSVPGAWRQQKRYSPTRVPDISFLDPVPALLADSERRLKEPAHPRRDFHALGGGEGGRTISEDLPTGFFTKPQAARIADLIERLEDAQGWKVAIPGAMDFALDPICEQLRKEGGAAVDSLLDVYEHDQRLTRTLDYSRPWMTDRTPIPVRQVAEVLLGEILGDPKWVRSSTPAELRAWWREHHTNTRAGMFFEVLADDRASPERWLEAAAYLTTRSDVHLAVGGLWHTEVCDPTIPVPAPYGEDLRPRQNPSVSDLLAKRTAALAASNSDLACRMAIKAALWDRTSALPALRSAAALESCRADRFIAIARLSLSDPGAAADWATEIKLEARSPVLSAQELSPLWMFPTDPVLQQTAKWLFAWPESPLSPILNSEMVDSPLLTLPVYRQAVLSALVDTKVVGTSTRSQEGLVSYRATNRSGGAPAEPGRDARVPQERGRPVRVKDLVALALSRLDGAPGFDLYWPEAHKDAIIKELTGFLKMHQKKLRASPPQLDSNCPSSVYLKP